MFRLSTVGVVSLAFSFVGFGLNSLPAIGATTYNFDATYFVLGDSLTFAAPDILEGLVQFTNPNAPFGLINGEAYRYIKILDPVTGEILSSTDPETFGLQNKPEGFFRLFGPSNEVSGDFLLTGINFGTPMLTFSGPIEITDGRGFFSDATGELFLRADREPAVNGFGVFGSLTTSTTVPEPSSFLALIVYGATVLLSRRILR